MKRLRLKGWVKVVIVIVFIGLLARCSYEENKKAISQCVENGNTFQFCKYHLGK